MKKHASILRTLACLLLIGCTVLCGCPAPNDGGTTGTTTTTTTTTGGSQNPDAPTPTVYGNGGAIEGTGDRLASDAPILTAPSYSTEGATEKTAAQMRAILRNANGVTADTVYVTTDEEAIGFIGANDRAYDGKGSVIVSKGGFLIDDCANIVIRNITLVGPVVITKSANVTFENVKFVCADGTAIKADAESSKIYVKNSRIDASVAAENSAVDFYLLDSYISFTANGILDLSVKNLYVRGNRFVGTAGAAIKTASQDAEIRKNTFTLPAASTAIEIGETKNVLVAENIIKDAQKAVLMIGADNSVIVRNSLISVEMKNSKHAYICDNAMGGKIIVSDIDYILADGNTYPNDEYNHETEQIGITNSNGDALMDVNARLSVGADENLLPHVDRDQFFGEERKTVVRDPDAETQPTLDKYVLDRAKTDDVIIVAPGAYKTWATFAFKKEHSNTTVYAYGMFAERSATAPAGAGSYAKLGSMITMEYAENISIKGGTYGCEYQGHAQAHVLEKIPGTSQIRVKTSAGFIKEFGLVAGGQFLNTTYAFRPENPYHYADVNHQKAEMQADGTVIVTFTTDQYKMIQVGDVLTNRPAIAGGHSVNTMYSKNISYKDLTIFGTMRATCFHEDYNESSITYYRCADTYRSGMVIDKETYDEYKELEKSMRGKGFTDFTTEVWYDEVHGCYRGPAFRNASLDGVHVVCSRGGAQVTSSLFERLGDDGTNHFADCVRLSSLRINDDGTADIIYKGNLTQYNYNEGAPAPYNRTPHLFNRPNVKVGDKIMLYTAGGNLILDAVAITDNTPRKNMLRNEPALVEKGGLEFLDTCHVKVEIKTYHKDMHDEYLPYLDAYPSSDTEVVQSYYCGPEASYKVYFHYGAYAAEGANFDNVKVSCEKAHAALFRSSNASIKNCTYEHIGNPAIAVLFNPFWGESAVATNIEFSRNLLSHTGYRDLSAKTHATICIDAPGELDINKTPLFTNIVVRDNVIKNRVHPWAIYVDGVDNIIIENNDLGRTADMEGTGGQKMAIYVQNCLNVKIEGNKYPNPTTPIKMTITLDNVKGLTGKDVNDGDMFPECK